VQMYKKKILILAVNLCTHKQWENQLLTWSNRLINISSMKAKHTY
jgi:hypothetical protein